MEALKNVPISWIAVAVVFLTVVLLFWKHTSNYTSPEPAPPTVSDPPTNSTIQCEPGTYSPTGFQPCIACSMNTYCPDSGMTAPKNCPPDQTSTIASTACTPMK